MVIPRSDDELRKLLQDFGEDVGPITPTTRSVYERRLTNLQKRNSPVKAKSSLNAFSSHDSEIESAVSSRVRKKRTPSRNDSSGRLNLNRFRELNSSPDSDVFKKLSPVHIPILGQGHKSQNDRSSLHHHNQHDKIKTRRSLGRSSFDVETSDSDFDSDSPFSIKSCRLPKKSLSPVSSSHLLGLNYESLLRRKSLGPWDTEYQSPYHFTTIQDKSKRELSEKKSNEESKLPTSTCKELPENGESKLPTSTCKDDKTPGCFAEFQSNNILQNFKKLYLNQEDCDVIIKVKGQEFPAHKLILKTQSPVFECAFRIDMKEKATGVVDIQDCEPSTFSDFLCFMYCGEIENLSQNNVFSLFTTADKYDVPLLRSLCLEFMKRNLTIDTFCDTIALALQHSEAELIKLSTDFFVQHFVEIIVTVKWQSFIIENPIQGNELMIKAVVPCKK